MKYKMYKSNNLLCSIKNEFPILNKNNGKELVYLDSAASSQKPIEVIKFISEVYENSYANVHRGSYKLSQIATDLYENARQKVSKFIGAKDFKEVVFTRGATEGINMIAHSWGLSNISKDDEIILSTLEHHSNIVPWQTIAKRVGAKIVELIPDKDGNISIDSVTALFTNKTKLISLAHVVNSIGSILPVKEVCMEAKKRNILTIIDGCQAAPNIPIDVQNIGCDFYVFSGHKLYAPSGIGVMYGRAELLESMEPYQTGGEMIDYVSIKESTFANIPHKFEAGTPNIVGAAALGAAIDFVNRVGIRKIYEHSLDMTKYGLEKLNSLSGIRIIGKPKDRISIISFLYEDIHPHDLAMLLDAKGFALRSGHHCAQPTMRHFKVDTTIRASVGIYNTKEDFDKLIEVLKSINKIFSK